MMKDESRRVPATNQGPLKIQKWCDFFWYRPCKFFGKKGHKRVVVAVENTKHYLAHVLNNY